MKYIMFGLEFFIFAMGAASLLLVLILYFVYRFRTVKYFFFFLAAVTARVFLSIIIFTMKINQDFNYYTFIVFYKICADISWLLFFVIPYILHRILDVSRIRLRNTVLSGLFITAVLCTVTPYLFSGRVDLSGIVLLIGRIPYLINIGLAVYISVLVPLYYKNLKNRPEEKSLSLLLSGFYLSYILFDYFASWMVFYIYLAADRMFLWAHLSFYFLWNALFIIFSVLYFRSFSRNMSDLEVTEDFKRNYDISEREEEIVRWLLKGQNNRQIGEKLFISSRTVKNHIYNIYKKTGAKTRMELSFLVQTSKSNK